MFQIGDYVVKPATGVCRVENILHLDLSKADKNRLYYLLIPSDHAGEKIYVPVDKDTFMRNVITKDEVYEYLNKLQFLSSYFIMVKKQLRRKTYAGTVTFYTIKGMDE